MERSGKRSDLEITDKEALEFAKSAAADFGVGAAWKATFDKDAVKKAAEKKKDEKAKKSEKTKHSK